MNSTSNHKIYIWQKNGWPEFRWNSDELLEPLSRLSRLHGELSGRMSMLGFTDRNQSLLTAMTEELINSSEIEGVQLNPASVRSSIARKLGIEENGTLASDHYVEGLVDVMLDAINNCNLPITPQRLFNWHAALFPTGRSGMRPITVADWRKGDEPMQVVSGAFGHEKVHYEAPPSEFVAAEMEAFLQWCDTTNLSPFIMAGVAHLWFVTIHPFDDGNGRLSRTIADLFLARADKSRTRYYSLSAEINRNKKSYYEILEQTQKGDLNITPWLLWFFGCIENAIAGTSAIIGCSLNKAAFWNRFNHIEVNERQRKIINRLHDGFEGKLTTSKWAKICGCSQDTALRDINDLIGKGMLKHSGESGRSANYLLP